MNIKMFALANRKRCESENGFNHRLHNWTPSDWMVATLGELGEAANVLKKLNRYRDGVTGNKETEPELKEMLKDELADTFIYLDLLCQSLGVDLSDVVVEKFNKTSKKIGYEAVLTPNTVLE